MKANLLPRLHVDDLEINGSKASLVHVIIVVV